MASLPNTGRSSALPIALLHQAQRKLSRSEQEDLIELLLEHIDRQDGDPDEEDATDLEDDRTFAADNATRIARTPARASPSCTPWAPVWRAATSATAASRPTTSEKEARAMMTIALLCPASHARLPEVVRCAEP